MSKFVLKAKGFSTKGQVVSKSFIKPPLPAVSILKYKSINNEIPKTRYKNLFNIFTLILKFY